MSTPDDEIAAFARATRTRNRIVKGVAIAVPVVILGLLARRCVSDELARREHNERVRASWERAEKSRRRQKEARARADVDRRKARLADAAERQALDEMLAEAGPLRQAAARAFAEKVPAAEGAGADCGGALDATDLSRSLALPREDKDALFGGVDLRMMDAVASSRGEYALSPEMRRGGRKIAVQLVKGAGESSAPLTSAVLRADEEGEKAAREEVARGLYPRDTSWAKPSGLEVVLLLDDFSMPALPYSADTPFDKTREFEGGKARGRAVVWSHDEQKVLCSAAFEAQSSGSIGGIEQYYTTIRGGLTQGSQGNRTVVLYALAVDFEKNLSAAIGQALGLR